MSENYMEIVADDKNINYLAAHLIVTSLFKDFKEKNKSIDELSIESKKDKIECFINVMKCLRLKVLGTKEVYCKNEDNLEVLMELSESIDLNKSVKHLIEGMENYDLKFKVIGNGKELNTIKKELINYNINNTTSNKIGEKLEELVLNFNEIIENSIRVATGTRGKDYIEKIEKIKVGFLDGLNCMKFDLIEAEIVNLISAFREFKNENDNIDKTKIDINKLVKDIKDDIIYSRDNITFNLVLNIEVEN